MIPRTKNNYFGADMLVVSICRTKNIAGDLNTMYGFQSGIITRNGATRRNGERFARPVGKDRTLATCSLEYALLGRKKKA